MVIWFAVLLAFGAGFVFAAALFGSPALKGADTMETFSIPDDLPDFPSVITPATAALDAEGNALEADALSKLLYQAKTSDGKVIARDPSGPVPAEPGLPLTILNHVGSPGECVVWVDTLTASGKLLASSPQVRFQVSTGEIASAVGAADDFSGSGLPTPTETP